jgi:hypothetical protein
MPHLPPAHHETSKCDSPNETKIKEKENITIPDLNSNLTKSMTHHNQTKKLTTWFLKIVALRHTKMVEELTVLRAAVSSVAKFTLGRSPNEAF